MSTQYAIINKKQPDDIFYEKYVIIGSSHEFTQKGYIIQQHLPDNTEIIGVGNETSLKTIKDLREYYEH